MLVFHYLRLSLEAQWAHIQLDSPVQLHEGRGPSVVAHDNSFALLYSRFAGESKGMNLFFRPSMNSKTEMRVNDVAGEVKDGGENGPILLKNSDGNHFYAVWNASDARHPLANRLRFAEWSNSARQWSKAITINDDVTPSTHTFQGAGIAPDGTVHVAWLDRRELPVGGPADYPGGGVHTGHKLLEDTAVLYTARWKRGKTFEKNVRVTGDICPCCRATVGFAKGKILLAWRSVDRNNVRDIAVSTSADGGLTWTSPKVAVHDDWKINACPHVGPSLATVGDTVYLAWMTRGQRGSGVFAATSKDAGLTFVPPVILSKGLGSATHPYLAARGNYAIAVFQGSPEKESAKPQIDHAAHSSHGAHSSHASSSSGAVFLTALQADGSPGPLLRIPGSGLSYPSAAVNQAGDIAVVWTQTQGERTTAWLAAGKLTASSFTKETKSTQKY